MNQQEQKAEAAKQKEIPLRYMMGTKAYHQLGDISRATPDLFRASGETEKYWVGMWVTGFGYFNVLFPKDTSTELTEEERQYWNTKYVQIGSQFPLKLKV